MGAHSKSGIKYGLILLFLHIATSFSLAAEPPLILATGSKGGVYYPLGKAISSVAAENGLKIQVIPSHGSIENIKLLENNKADLAIVQNDIVHYAYNGMNVFDKPNPNIRFIVSLYTEKVQILVRNALYISKIEDFRNKRISLGIKDSGTEANALAILEAAGITENEVKPLHLSFEESIERLKNGEIDIAFITAGVPVDIIRDAINEKNTVLFSLGQILIKRLIAKYPYLTATAISPNTYPYQDDEIPTIGVKALLVTKKNIADEVIYSLTKAIFENKEKIAQRLQREYLELSVHIENIPIHSGSRRYIEENSLYEKEYFKKFVVPISILLILILVIVVCWQNNYIREKTKHFIATQELVDIFVVIVLIVIVEGVFLYYFEHNVNEDYSNPIIALWSGFVSLISFGSKEPVTTEGKLILVITYVAFGGTAIFFVSNLISDFVRRKIEIMLRGGKKMPRRLKNHFVIINWNDNGYEIVKQLHHKELGEKKPILILASETDNINLPSDIIYEKVYVEKGDTNDEDFLKKANICHALSAIILADKALKNLADAKSALTIAAIRKICVDNNTRQVPITVEIENPRTPYLRSYIGKENKDEVEIVSSKKFSQYLLAQSAFNPGISKIYDDLLTFGTNDNEIYRTQIPQNFIGRTFNELIKHSSEIREKENLYVIPVAVSQNGKICLNPKEIKPFSKDDFIYVICESPKDLKKYAKIV